MGLVTKQYTFSAGGVIVAAEHNANFDDLYNEFNGSISNANISASAAIVDTKLASITTASKVSGAALTTLTSIPSGAGLIPSANQDTVATLTDQATITTDASLGTIFTVTLGDNRTLGAPTNAVAGMKRIWRFKQDGTGSRTISLNAIFRVPTDIGSVTLSTAL